MVRPSALARVEILNGRNKKMNTFRGVPKAELERRTQALLQAMTVSFDENEK